MPLKQDNKRREGSPKIKCYDKAEGCRYGCKSYTDRVCHSYAKRGQCSYGVACRFKHIELGGADDSNAPEAAPTGVETPIISSHVPVQEGEPNDVPNHEEQQEESSKRKAEESTDGNKAKKARDIRRDAFDKLLKMFDESDDVKDINSESMFLKGRSAGIAEFAERLAKPFLK